MKTRMEKMVRTTKKIQMMSQSHTLIKKSKKAEAKTMTKKKLYLDLLESSYYSESKSESDEKSDSEWQPKE